MHAGAGTKLYNENSATVAVEAQTTTTEGWRGDEKDPPNIPRFVYTRACSLQNKHNWDFPINNSAAVCDGLPTLL